MPHAERAQERLREGWRNEEASTSTGAWNRSFHPEPEAPEMPARRDRTSPPPESVNYAAFFRALWRRKGLLTVIVLVGLAASTFIVMRLPARYVAHAFVALGDPYPRNRSVAGVASASVQSQPDVGTVQTEVEVLKSPQLALKVINKLNLGEQPEFAVGGGLHDTLSAKLEKLLGNQLARRILGPPAKSDPETEAAVRQSLVVEAFRGRLRAGPKDTSRMIDVAFEASDPKLAMKIVNAVADEYMLNQLELRSQNAKRNSDWLRERIGQLRATLQEAERAVEQYRAKAGLFSTPGGAPLLLKEMTDVSAELAKAQTAGAALEAQLVQLKAASGNERSVQSSGSSPLSPLLQTLEAQEADASQRLAEAQATLGPRNPGSVGITDRLRHIRAAIANERRRVIASLEGDLQVARRKEKDLSSRLSLLQADVARMNASEITMHALERDAEADRLILNTFLSRFKEASQESDISSQRPDAQVVSYAQLPAAPDKPKRELMILICGLASLLIGVTTVQVLEKRNRTLRDVQEIESQLNIRALGMIPIADAARLAPCEAARYGTEYREAVKGTYTRLFWTSRPPKVILVTSAFPGEGKTTLALSLAALAAQGSQRTLFVDADFWRKGASAALDLNVKFGLAEILEGNATLASAVVNDLSSGADILLSGQFTRGSLLSWAGTLPKVFETFRKNYDIVIVDAPPVLSVTEAALLGSHTDAAVVAVRWKSTPRDAVEVAIRRLRESGAVPAGAVITMVEDRQPAAYADAESKYLLASLSGYGQSTGAVTAHQRRPLAAVNGSTALEKARSRSRPVSPRNRSVSTYALMVLGFAEDSAGWTPADPNQSPLAETIDRISAAAARAGITLLHGREYRKWFQDREVREEGQSESVPRFSFTMPTADAFSSDNLHKFLAQRDIGQLFLVGGADAVAKTARSALDKGYRVAFIRDAIAADSEVRWAKMLKSFELEAAFAVTSHEFLEFALAAEIRRLDTDQASA